MIDPGLRRLLSRRLDWDFHAAKISPLHGGITNHNSRVDLADASYVVRIGCEGAEKLGIDRAREYRCSKIAAAAGIAPEVVAFFPEKRVLVTRFIEGRPLSSRGAAQPSRLRRIAATIRRLHDGPRFPGAFSPFETVRRYHRLAVKNGITMPRRTDDALAAMARIEKAVRSGARRAPCHNDLLAGNFIDDGRRIRILDWEYSAMGDPFFDLGNFCVNQSLGPATRRALLKAYFGRVRAADVKRLDDYRLVSDLREAFWGFAQAGLSSIRFDFLAYGRKHLERFWKEAQ